MFSGKQELVLKGSGGEGQTYQKFMNILTEEIK